MRGPRTMLIAYVTIVVVGIAVSLAIGLAHQ
jgi:hypothetical protein